MTTPTASSPRPLRRTIAAVAALALAATLVTAVAPSPAGAGHISFADVPPGHYAHAAVAWGAHAGHTSGVGGTNQFQPGRNITRAELVTLLWRVAGRPSSAHPLSIDVPPNHFAAPAVRWALQTGVTTGVGGTNRFAPDEPITRAQIITMMWRSENRPDASAATLLPDVHAGHWSAMPVRWAYAEGISYGVSHTRLFFPHRNLSRAEAITFIYRLETGATAPAPEPEAPYDPDHQFLAMGGDGLPARWNACDVIRYHVDYAGAHGNATRVVPAAIAHLQRVSGLTFQQTADPNAANFWIYWQGAENPVFNGQNPTSGVAGYSRYASVGSHTVQIMAAEVVINRNFSTGPSDFGGHNSLGTLMLHELGHAVGLGHVNTDTEVMFPVITPLSTYQGGDRYGLRTVGSRLGCTSAFSAAFPSAASGAGDTTATLDDATWSEPIF